MNKTTKWILGTVAALAVSGLAFTMPAMAEEQGPKNMMHGMMQSHGDMAAMHNVMMPLMSQMPAMHEQMMGEIAQLLGMTADELEQAVKEQSLAEIAEDQGVAIGEVRAAMTNGMKTFLDKLVTDETITQGQAGQMLGFMEKKLESCLNGQMGSMMGSGMMGMH